MTRESDAYRPEDIEPRAQELWERLGVSQARGTHRESNGRKQFYCLDMFPYPSGEGLHVGHVEGYTATDVYSRYLRMRGYDVLHPMGWDAFGLPAENTAIQQKIHPRALVEKNVTRFKRQLQRLGLAYDWSREINTTDPAYYRWTQWIFLKLFHLGLAYEAEVPINWCPSCQTGLANEEVVDGKCERCGTPVGKKNLRQWMLRITKYADRLLRDLDGLDWPEGIKELQRHWIGRSEGVEVVFMTADRAHTIPVFTTRTDTLCGATYMVLAPEHPLVDQITVPEERAAVRRYVEAACVKSDRERTALGKEKTGVDTGAKAINPVNGEEIPVWVADYVLASYGTGAIMAVPAHDERDFAFAKKYGLPIREVIRQHQVFARGQTPGVERLGASTDDGVLVESGEFTGLSSSEAREKITAWLAERNLGQRTVNYKLRDWVFSRQRYWGEPIPIVHCVSCGVVPVSEGQLPVLLPDVERYEPAGTGESPLAAIAEWVHTTCPQCGGAAERETNTMPQWAGSCWYFLRFCDPQNGKEPWSWEALERWMPVDLYVGGAEHAVLHLLYARFWMKALYDGGYVPMEEPFQKLRNQGTILGPNGQKMSKSRGNVVNPDEIVARYGADTLRLYEMFLGPLEAGKPWNPRAVSGVSRFLHRVWRLGHGSPHPHESDIRAGTWGAPHPHESDIRAGTRGAWALGYVEDTRREDRDLKPMASGLVKRALHKLIKKVTEDIEALKFNTAIAAMMEFLHRAEREGISPENFRTFLIILSPFAPHIAEELWQRRGQGEGTERDHGPGPMVHGRESITQQSWPVSDPADGEEAQVTIVVQVNGRVRDTMVVPSGLPDDEVRGAAAARERAAKWLQGRSVRTVVVVPDRLVNFVLG